MVHCTGSGKTLTMIRALDNFFLDPRPKVAVFPTDAVCKNFYRELGAWPQCLRVCLHVGVWWGRKTTRLASVE